MKNLILVATIFCLLFSCENGYRRSVLNNLSDESIDSTTYPLFIDSGKQVVYQFGHLTPDKGLKLFLDTIPHPEGGLTLDEAVRQQLGE